MFTDDFVGISEAPEGPFFLSLLLSSSTRRRFYPQRSSGQAEGLHKQNREGIIVHLIRNGE